MNQNNLKKWKCTDREHLQKKSLNVLDSLLVNALDCESTGFLGCKLKLTSGTQLRRKTATDYANWEWSPRMLNLSQWQAGCIMYSMLGQLENPGHLWIGRRCAKTHSLMISHIHHNDQLLASSIGIMTSQTDATYSERRYTSTPQKKKKMVTTFNLTDVILNTDPRDRCDFIVDTSMTCGR